MPRVTDNTHTEKIGGDSIFVSVVFQVVAGNRYDKAKKAKASYETWDRQHTSDSHDSLKESLIPNHLLSGRVRPRYDERAQKVEELRSTTDVR